MVFEFSQLKSVHSEELMNERHSKDSLALSWAFQRRMMS